ncbi:hypothetical protein BRADI_3g37486v3 [Brachypodium distachyon]|uniref:Uncharacterized protein n=1 Tax=Brachypodium distachyon TaxID=15368 RepID=A0A0Q3FFY1_BRADI|nr:hypothetical protein BRADI_3g37486v3 [Brachypodium distachyon]
MAQTRNCSGSLPFSPVSEYCLNFLNVMWAPHGEKFGRVVSSLSRLVLLSLNFCSAPDHEFLERVSGEKRFCSPSAGFACCRTPVSSPAPPLRLVPRFGCCFFVVFSPWLRAWLGEGFIGV